MRRLAATLTLAVAVLLIAAVRGLPDAYDAEPRR